MEEQLSALISRSRNPCFRSTQSPFCSLSIFCALCVYAGDKVMDMKWLLAGCVCYLSKGRLRRGGEQKWHSLDGQQVVLILFVALEAFDY